MTCARYWSEGIVLVERGEGDPHRAGCVDCTRAHASRQELIEALPLIGAGRAGTRGWQANVWRQIDGERVGRRARWRWQLACGLAVACALALWLGRGGPGAVAQPPVFEVIAGGVAMRSSSAVVGDRLRVWVDAASEVWIYRADRLVLRCRARQGSGDCALDRDGMAAVLLLSVADSYDALVVPAPVAPPHGELDVDRAALISAGASYVEHHLVAR
jgi:hypothetical protein